MHGKTVVITGGNGGIGKETAIALARQGARVIIAVRDPVRGAAAVDRHRGAQRFDRCRATRHSILRRSPRYESSRPPSQTKTDELSVLINNAGVVLRRRQTTADGFEMTFGVNHLGHFLLTELLHDLLERGAPRGSSSSPPTRTKAPGAASTSTTSTSSTATTAG